MRNPEPLFHASRCAGAFNDRQARAPEYASPGALSGPYFAIANVACKGATGKALHVQLPGQDRLTWIPRSQVDPSCTLELLGRTGELRVTMWWAAQRGLR